MSQITGASGGGGGGDLVGQLVGIGAGLLGIPGFASGGIHDGGLRIVGENGPEVEFTGPSTILPADLTKQIMTAKSAPVLQIAMAPGVNSNHAPPSAQSPGIVVEFHDHVGVKAEQTETVDAAGNRRMIMTIGEMTASAAKQPGNPLNRTLDGDFATKRRGISR